MKIVKNIIVYTLFLSISLYAQEEQTTSDINKSETTTSETPATEEIKKSSDLAENVLQNWQDHAKKLLEKGVLWNTDTNTPADSWKTEAFDIAKATLEKDKTVADELKSSFASTINEKISTENGTSSEATTELINAFNKHIDDLLQPKEEMKSQPEEKKTEIEKPAESKEESTEEKTESVTSDSEKSTPSEIPPLLKELGSESTQQTTEEKPSPEKPAEEQRSAQDTWIDYLKNISKELSSDEFIKNAQKKAQNLLSSLPPAIRGNALNKIREDFQKALEYQSSQQYIPGMQQQIQAFNKSLEEAAAQEVTISGTERPIRTAEGPMGRTIMESSTQGPVGMVGKEKVTGQYISQPAIGTYQGIPSNDQIQYQMIGAQNIPITDDEILQQKDFQQALLQQLEQRKKAEEEKMQKKSALAQLMQSVFNVDIDQWFKKEKVEENIPKIIETILNKEPNIKDKNMKKNAYLSFQNTLLSFNSKEFWDSKNNKPNQLWINKIKNELTVLIHYKMITINQALSIIDKTLKIGDKISEFDRSHIRENIKDFLNITLLPITQAFYDNSIIVYPLIALLQ
jgi:hypothetical protein